MKVIVAIIVIDGFAVILKVIVIVNVVMKVVNFNSNSDSYKLVTEVVGGSTQNDYHF